VCPAWSWRHAFCDRHGAGPFLAAHGPADLARLALSLGTLLRLGIRQLVRRRPRHHVLAAIPDREVEIDARHRSGAEACRRGIQRTKWRNAGAEKYAGG